MDATKRIEENPGYAVNTDFAYSLKVYDDKVVYTLYSKYQNPVKTISTYNIVNEKIESVSKSEIHFTTKLAAMLETYQYKKENSQSIYNIKRIDNIMYYDRHNIDNRTKEELIDGINELDGIYTKINE